MPFWLSYGYDPHFALYGSARNCGCGTEGAALKSCLFIGVETLNIRG